MKKLNKDDVVYYVECHFGCVKHNILQTTVGLAIEAFDYNIEDVQKSFNEQKTKTYFILNSVDVTSFLRNYRFYFKKTGAAKELLTYLDKDISRVSNDLKNLKSKRKAIKNEK